MVEGQPGLNIAEPANSPEEGAVYPGATALADHILDSLRTKLGHGAIRSTPSGAPRGGIPHAYRLLLSHHPEGPHAAERSDHPERSFPAQRPEESTLPRLGRALAKAIKTFDGYQRIAVMASGGLTHFVIDEEFDRAVMNAMRAGDEDALANLPEHYFKVVPPRPRTGSRSSLR